VSPSFPRLPLTLTKAQTPVGRGESTPRHLRIYANYPTIVDFADAENTTPQLNISLLEGETGVVEYPFRVAAFTSITSLSLFFVSPNLVGFMRLTPAAERATRWGEMFRGSTMSDLKETPNRHNERRLQSWRSPQRMLLMLPSLIECLKEQEANRRLPDSLPGLTWSLSLAHSMSDCDV
jgi:hypothetical protein